MVVAYLRVSTENNFWLINVKNFCVLQRRMDYRLTSGTPRR